MEATELRQRADSDGLFEKPVYGIPVGHWCAGLHEALLLIESGVLAATGGDPTADEERTIHAALLKPPVSEVLNATAQIVRARLISPGDGAGIFAGWAGWYEVCTILALIELRRRYGGA
jgi:hypothetical protein